MSREASVLCYVDECCWAYFTTQELSKQWGDDWNDAPYEHNAGTPYSPYKPEDDWKIYKVGFDASYKTPCDCCSNSQFSVEDINRGDIAWLRPWGDGTPIHAGTTLSDFRSIIEASGGSVYEDMREVESDRPTEKAGE